MKRIISVLMLVCLMASFCTLSAFAAEVTVSTLAELQAALADSTATGITLTKKIDITSDTTIDGNGKTVTYTGTDDRVINVETSGVNLTVKNLTLVGHTNRAINYNTTGKLTLENVTIKGDSSGEFTYAVNLPSNSKNSLVEINNCNISGNIPLNIWGENLVADVNNSKLACIDNNSSEGYAAIALCKNSTGDAANAVVNVNGGSLSATDDSAAISISSTNGKVNVSGATVSGPTIINAAYIEYTGGNSYSFTSLAEAIEFAKGGETVELLTDVDLGGNNIEVTKDITINQNGHSIKNGYVIFPDGSKLGSAPAVSNPYAVPSTGDMSNMPLWAVLFVGFAAVAVLTRKKKA